MVLSFGFEDDLRRLLPHLPKVVQTLLMSATLSAVRAAAAGTASGTGRQKAHLGCGVFWPLLAAPPRTLSNCSGCCCTIPYVVYLWFLRGCTRVRRMSLLHQTCMTLHKGILEWTDSNLSSFSLMDLHTFMGDCFEGR